MAHSVEIPYLDKENIEIYLNDLATEIEKAKIGKRYACFLTGRKEIVISQFLFCLFYFFIQS